MSELWDTLSQAQQPAASPDMWRAPYGVGSEAEMAGSPSGLGSLASGLYQYLGNLAKRSLGASEQMRSGGTYDPAPAIDAALLTMGGGIGGTGEGVGTALGSGPARNLMLENADLYKELANQARAKGYATGKSAAGWDFTRPAPEKGSWADLLARTNAGWEADKARAIGAYEQAAPGAVERSPYMTDADYAEVAKPNFVLGSGATDKRAAAAIQGIRAYHGSPYDFERFDLSKIGTGEGAQAYGHGLYFAENERVAKQYRDTLTKSFNQDLPTQGYYVGRDPIDAYGTGLNQLNDKFRQIGAGAEGKIDQATILRAIDAELAPHYSGRFKGPLAAENMAKWEEARKFVEGNPNLSWRPEPYPGKMYEVNINADPAHFLDWDKPLAMDNAARAKLAELGDKGMAYHGFGVDRQFAKDAILSAQNPNLTGEGAYRVMGKAVDQARPILKEAGDPRALFGDLGAMSSQQLQQAGIPGIKYLDQGSRGMAKQSDELLKIYGTPERVREVAQQAVKRGEDADYWQSILRGLGDRSHNYVVFNDKLIDILRKYGIAGIAPMAAGFGFQPTANEQRM